MTKDGTDLVPVPIFQHSILTYCPEAVGLFLKKDLHDTFLMGKDRSMTITKIKAPNLDILIRGTCHDEFGVIRNIHG